MTKQSTPRITLVQACFRLHLNYDRAHRAAIAGKFPAERTGNRWMIAEDALPALRRALVGKGGAA